MIAPDGEDPPWLSLPVRATLRLFGWQVRDDAQWLSIWPRRLRGVALGAALAIGVLVVVGPFALRILVWGVQNPVQAIFTALFGFIILGNVMRQ